MFFSWKAGAFLQTGGNFPSMQGTVELGWNSLKRKLASTSLNNTWVLQQLC